MELNQLKVIFNEIKSWDKSISSDIAIDCSTRIYNSKNIESKKEYKSSERKDDDDQPRSTDKQQNYLYGLGYDGDASKLSIQEAKHLIEALKKKQ
jgi:hypothetical protein